MIYRAWFQEFRALRDVTVDLARLTVFVGPNGSGKTSVLEGVHDVLRVARQPIQDVLVGPWRADRLRNTRATGPMKLGVAFDPQKTQTFELEVTVTPSREDDPDAPNHARRYEAKLTARADAAEQSWDATSKLPHRLGTTFEAIPRGVARAVFLRLSARALAEPHYSDEEVPTISPDGEGLASVIAHLASSDPDRMEAITLALREVVPSVRRVRTERARITRQETELITIGAEQVPRHREVRYWGHGVVLDTTSGESIPLVAASEGTVLSLGLMTVLHGHQRPRTLLMDDLDRALHPKAQQDLVRVLRAVMKADPELQVIGTSHSPFLLDALEHDEVRLTTLADDGSVLCGALRDHPQFRQWERMVKPGELWTAGLEDWLRASRSVAP